MSAEKVYRSKPILIEQDKPFMVHGTPWCTVRVTMMDGNQGFHYYPAEVDPGFVVNIPCSYTLTPTKAKLPKMRPFDMTEFDRQRSIERQHAVTSAIALGYDKDTLAEGVEVVLRITQPT